MKIYNYIGLSVFASICFGAGFILGEKTTYDEKYEDDLKNLYLNQCEELSNLNTFGHTVQTVIAMQACGTEGEKDIYAMYQSMLEDDYDKYINAKNEDIKVLLQFQLNAAKKILEK